MATAPPRDRDETRLPRLFVAERPHIPASGSTVAFPHAGGAAGAAGAGSASDPSPRGPQRPSARSLGAAGAGSGPARRVVTHDVLQREVGQRSPRTTALRPVETRSRREQRTGGTDSPAPSSPPSPAPDPAEAPSATPPSATKKKPASPSPAFLGLDDEAGDAGAGGDGSRRPPSDRARSRGSSPTPEPEPLLPADLALDEDYVMVARAFLANSGFSGAANFAYARDLDPRVRHSNLRQAYGSPRSGAQPQRPGASRTPRGPLAPRSPRTHHPTSPRSLRRTEQAARASTSSRSPARSDSLVRALGPQSAPPGSSRDADARTAPESSEDAPVPEVEEEGGGVTAAAPSSSANDLSAPVPEDHSPPPSKGVRWARHSVESARPEEVAEEDLALEWRVVWPFRIEARSHTNLPDARSRSAGAGVTGRGGAGAVGGARGGGGGAMGSSSQLARTVPHPRTGRDPQPRVSPRQTPYEMVVQPAISPRGRGSSPRTSPSRTRLSASPSATRGVSPRGASRSPSRPVVGSSSTHLRATNAGRPPWDSRIEGLIPVSVPLGTGPRAGGHGTPAESAVVLPSSRVAQSHSTAAGLNASAASFAAGGGGRRGGAAGDTPPRRLRLESRGRRAAPVPLSSGFVNFLETNYADFARRLMEGQMRVLEAQDHGFHTPDHGDEDASAAGALEATSPSSRVSTPGFRTAETESKYADGKDGHAESKRSDAETRPKSSSSAVRGSALVTSSSDVELGGAATSSYAAASSPASTTSAAASDVRGSPGRPRPKTSDAPGGTGLAGGRINSRRDALQGAQRLLYRLSKLNPADLSHDQRLRIKALIDTHTEEISRTGATPPPEIDALISWGKQVVTLELASTAAAAAAGTTKEELEDRSVMLNLELEYAPGEWTSLPVREGDKPSELASRFIAAYNLPDSFYDAVLHAIQGSIDKFLEKKREEEELAKARQGGGSPRTSPPRGGASGSPPAPRRRVSIIRGTDESAESPRRGADAESNPIEAKLELEVSPGNWTLLEIRARDVARDLATQFSIDHRMSAVFIPKIEKMIEETRTALRGSRTAPTASSPRTRRASLVADVAATAVVLFEVALEYLPGQEETIVVREGDDLGAIADSFTRRHDLDDEMAPQVRRLLEQFAAQARATASSSPRRGARRASLVRGVGTTLNPTSEPPLFVLELEVEADRWERLPVTGTESVRLQADRFVTSCDLHPDVQARVEESIRSCLEAFQQANPSVAIPILGRPGSAPRPVRAGPGSVPKRISLLAAPTRPSTAGSRPRTAERQVLFDVTVEYQPGLEDTIVVHQGDSLTELSTSFVSRHGLDASFTPHVERLLSLLFDQTIAAKEGSRDTTFAGRRASLVRGVGTMLEPVPGDVLFVLELEVRQGRWERLAITSDEAPMAQARRFIRSCGIDPLTAPQIEQVILANLREFQAANPDRAIPILGALGPQKPAAGTSPRRPEDNRTRRASLVRGLESAVGIVDTTPVASPADEAPPTPAPAPTVAPAAAASPRPAEPSTAAASPRPAEPSTAAASPRPAEPSTAAASPRPAEPSTVAPAPAPAPAPASAPVSAPAPAPASAPAPEPPVVARSESSASRAAPIMVLDLEYEPDKFDRIEVWKDSDLRSLAVSFVRRHNLDLDLVNAIEAMLKANMPTKAEEKTGGTRTRRGSVVRQRDDTTAVAVGVATAAVGGAGADRAPILFEFDLEYSPGEWDRIAVPEGASATALAKDFMAKHKLDATLEPIVEELFQRNIESALSIRTPSPRPGTGEGGAASASDGRPHTAAALAGSSAGGSTSSRVRRASVVEVASARSKGGASGSPAPAPTPAPAPAPAPAPEIPAPIMVLDLEYEPDKFDRIEVWKDSDLRSLAVSFVRRHNLDLDLVNAVEEALRANMPTKAEEKTGGTRTRRGSVVRRAPDGSAVLSARSEADTARPKILFEFDLEYAPGEWDRIAVPEGASATALAKDFMAKHKLDATLEPIVEELFQRNIESALSIRTPSPRPGTGEGGAASASDGRPGTAGASVSSARDQPLYDSSGPRPATAAPSAESTSSQGGGVAATRVRRASLVRRG